MKGKFIVIEGLDGSGKGQAQSYMYSLLDNAGIPYTGTREPGGTPLAEDIRELLLAIREEPFDPMAELLMMQAARAQNVNQVIKPALERGEWVICDRFIESTWAYQGGGRGLDLQAIQASQDLAIGSFRPDFSIILDVPTSIGQSRTKGRGDQDRLDKQKGEFYDNVRNMYLYRAENDPSMKVVDSAQKIEQVHLDIKKIFNEYIHDFLCEKEHNKGSDLTFKA